MGLSRSAPRFRRSWRACLVVALGLTAPDARADAVGEALRSRFGSDKANLENARGLIAKGVTFDASAGLWYANLNGGISSLANGWSAAGGGESPSDKAASSIGTGSGFVRELKLGVNVKGNEAYFDYLSDQIAETAGEEASKRVDNPLARRIIQKLAGELRPDLKKILGPDAQVYVRGEYGKLQGEIENATTFGSRNGKPYFGGRNEGWTTQYFGFELGVYPDGKNRVGDRGTSSAFGFFGRYRNFSRPLALGFSPDESTARFFLSDGVVTTYEIGAKAEIAACDTFCFLAEGSLVPFTGYVHLDLGSYGDAGTALVALGGRLEASYPIKLTDTVFIGPYLGFRMELLQPANFSFGQDIANGVDIDRVEIWSPDYLFWGPTAGLVGRL